MFSLPKRFRHLIAGMAMTCAASASLASGLVPETTLLLIREADGESVVNVKNTDDVPLLLRATVRHIPEDKTNLLVIDPPVARVEPGQKQLVRFMLINREPLKTQRLQRIIFDGIPPSRGGANSVQVSIRHNIPAVIHPKNLAIDPEPWKRLVWSVNGQGALQVSNPSPYVVRLAQEVQTKPTGKMGKLPKPYVLPGETIVVATDDGVASAARNVVISPATVYGIYVDTYEATVSSVPPNAPAAASATSIAPTT